MKDEEEPFGNFDVARNIATQLLTGLNCAKYGELFQEFLQYQMIKQIIIHKEKAITHMYVPVGFHFPKSTKLDLKQRI